MKTKRLGLRQKRIKRKQIRTYQLFASLIISIVLYLITCVGLIGVTYAWFENGKTTNDNNVSSGIVFLKLYNTNSLNDNNFFERQEINEVGDLHPVFGEEDSFGLGNEIVKYVAVVNEGDLLAEYNIGITVESINNGDDDLEKGDLSEIIDVFFAEVIKEKDSETNEDRYYIDSFDLQEGQEIATPKYVYLGKLKDVNEKAINIKGLLNPKKLAEEDGSLYDYEKLYCLRLKMPAEADVKYQQCSIKLNVELDATQYKKDICFIKALTNDEEKGLVLGGGTYYVNEDFEISLQPLANKGFKFSRWIEDLENIVYDNPRVINECEDNEFLAEFIIDETYEHEDIDPIWDDDDDEEEEDPSPYEEGEDDL